MNPTIETLHNHRSYRSYKDNPVEAEKLDLIIKAAQSAPSWIHGQQVSIIAIKDEQRKKELARLCGNQKHIEEAPLFLVFCADFYRASLAGEIEGKTLEALNDVDSLLVGATDVGLGMGYAIAAAESVGLGTVPIGGVRRNSLEVVEFLQLPKHVIPISGLCVGYGAEDPGQKPRLPVEAVLHEETYKQDQKAILEQYNKIMPAPWTQRVASFYEKSYYANIAKMLKQQGFSCDDLN
ncbi:MULTISPECIES: NADPH-dependent oxidoreductase [Bacillus]|uniref:FMN reductase n=2 Tax=Bacillus TaxID=1386 RepID=A0A0M4FL77_9BACI|nr:MULTISPECIES: NADPH-dependent oxidoreductase [Bacillus]ALC82717.1 FMN reductase [Bacillus gobiensis]MBP1081669.1 FMN reductase [NAD(P)H] [Bacillus capparidis]MED1096322.1 NADPH-dependent oxidoreductase [Bacillus capparidis]